VIVKTGQYDLAVITLHWSLIGGYFCFCVFFSYVVNLFSFIALYNWPTICIHILICM